jgi:hypothetical protein
MISYFLVAVYKYQNVALSWDVLFSVQIRPVYKDQRSKPDHFAWRDR